jgi:hypothetical protein
MSVAAVLPLELAWNRGAHDVAFRGGPGIHLPLASTWVSSFTAAWVPRPGRWDGTVDTNVSLLANTLRIGWRFGDGAHSPSGLTFGLGDVNGLTTRGGFAIGRFIGSIF